MIKETTNTPSFWYGHIADDNRGHQGAGNAPQEAQAALEQVQRDNVPSAEYKSITGMIINNNDPL